MKQPLKILFDASPLLANKTGVAYYIERLITALAAQYPDSIELIGFYYNFLGRANASHLPVTPNIRYRPIRFIPSKVVYQLRRFGIEIPIELLAKEKVDFILYGNFIGYPSLHHTPSATVVHDLAYIDLPEYVAAKNRSDLTRFVPVQIQRSNFIMTVSQFTQQRLKEVYPHASQDILITPIPPKPTIKLDSATAKLALQAIGITKPFILSLGTIEPRKNIPALIDAYLALPEDIQAQYSLVLAGRIGWNCETEVQKIKDAQQQGSNVLHLGYVDDITSAALMQQAALFVSLSHYEGFGMPVLEAMSNGRPCLINDIPVFHEVAADSARYVTAQDSSSVTRALQDLLTHPAILKEYGIKGSQRAASFNWPQVARSVYAKVSAVTATSSKK